MKPDCWCRLETPRHWRALLRWCWRTAAFEPGCGVASPADWREIWDGAGAPHDSGCVRGGSGEKTVSAWADGRLRLPNLLNDFGTLVELTAEALDRAQWLDAFLLAAGVNQMAEDYLHPDPLAATRLAPRAALLPGPAGSLASTIVQELSRGLGAIRSRRADALGWSSCSRYSGPKPSCRQLRTSSRTWCCRGTPGPSTAGSVSTVYALA